MPSEELGAANVGLSGWLDGALEAGEGGRWREVGVRDGEEMSERTVKAGGEGGCKKRTAEKRGEGGRSWIAGGGDGE